MLSLKQVKEILVSAVTSGLVLNAAALNGSRPKTACM